MLLELQVLPVQLLLLPCCSHAFAVAPEYVRSPSVGAAGPDGTAGGLLPLIAGQPEPPGAHTCAKGSAIGAEGATHAPVLPGRNPVGGVGGAPQRPMAEPV